MRDQEPETIVVFRKWKDGAGILALFPEEPSDDTGWYCSSYMHVGQHGGADPHLTSDGQTLPATPAEYKDLKRELESEPYRYRLKVRRRVTRAMTERRRQALRCRQ